jgi:hypothetical protein
VRIVQRQHRITRALRLTALAQMLRTSQSPRTLSSIPAAMCLVTAPNLRLVTMRLWMVVTGLAITVPWVGQVDLLTRDAHCASL